MKKVGLVILDGWGLGDHSQADAITQAKTPVMDGLMSDYPTAQLLTSGEHVGLPKGQMGNSEVGHLNIGAGRIVYQELSRINKAIVDKSFFEINVLKEALLSAHQLKKKVHFIGLVSEGGVHSAQGHLHALCDLAKQIGLEKVFIHAFTDGRDCDPKSGKNFISNLEDHISNSNIKLASMIGRYYAMDRDNRWERIKKAYDLMVHQKGEFFESSNKAFETKYEGGITDEFLDPIILTKENAKIEEGDVVISFNFRTDRPREIISALCQKAYPSFGMTPLKIEVLTMTKYDDTFSNVEVIFEKENLIMTLGEVLEKEQLKQVRIAETEKYPHVTFFFSGGREVPFEQETRILVNSPKVATYDLQPEMSAFEVKDRIINELQANAPDFFCLNFANADMVGHTGVYDAIIKAVESVDSCLGEVVEAGRTVGYELIIIADHGNADVAYNADGSPNTAHSLNPVPFVLVTEDDVRLSNGILADVAPTILKRMGIQIPEQMTGTSLVN